MAQCHAPAEGWVGDGHHAVASSGVVFTEAPAQGIEVRELPGVQDPSQKKRSCEEVWGGKQTVRCQQTSPKQGSLSLKVNLGGLCSGDQQSASLNVLAIAVINTMAKDNTRKSLFLLTTLRLEVVAGTQGRPWRRELRHHGGTLLGGCFSWLAQLCFLI